MPTGAGLGGGSSNAATALWAANQFNGCVATEKELQEWSSEIGSDIPFFFSMLLGLVENDDTPVSTRLDTDTDTGSVLDSSNMAIAGEKQQRFPQIPTPTNRRNPKIIFVNMVFLVGQGKNFTLVNIIDANSCKDLGFNEMANTG